MTIPRDRLAQVIGAHPELGERLRALEEMRLRENRFIMRWGEKLKTSCDGGGDGGSASGKGASDWTANSSFSKTGARACVKVLHARAGDEGKNDWQRLKLVAESTAGARDRFMEVVGKAKIANAPGDAPGGAPVTSKAGGGSDWQLNPSWRDGCIKRAHARIDRLSEVDSAGLPLLLHPSLPLSTVSLWHAIVRISTCVSMISVPLLVSSVRA